jgi:hypothetical protein
MRSGAAALHDLAPPPGWRPVLAVRPLAWLLSLVVVVITQVMMWNGWNRSGEWIDVTGSTAVFGYLFNGVVTAVPVVVALLCLRRWLSLIVALAALLVLAARTAAFFETSDSSTAIFALFAFPLYGVPFVLGLVFLEWVWTRVCKRRTATAKRP